MPIDINLLREDKGGDPEKVRESQRRRFASVELVDELLEQDNLWRYCRGGIDLLAKEKNAVQKVLSAKRKKGEQDEVSQNRVKEIGVEIKKKEAELAGYEARVNVLLPQIGNIVADDVPVSNDEEKDSVVVSEFGALPTGPQYLHHHEVLHKIGGYEPERGVNVAGHRGYFLKDAGLMLSQALIQYSMSFLRKKNYSCLQPPFFMNKEMMAGVAQLSQFDEELYKVTAAGDPTERYLIATSEQPLCVYHKGEYLQESELPKKYAGVSTCFRKEAGAHGKDTWGIFRVHQFEKVEQFCVCECDLEKSNQLQWEMLKVAEEFYQSLGLSYKVINIVSGELNNAAIKKYDLEAWFPAYEEFRELVSCSNCTDYQSRSMQIRSGVKKLNQTEKRYCHLLNSTLCATTRTVSCILETFQTEDGVNVPPVLVPYMDGMTFLPYVRELPAKLMEAKGATKGGRPVQDSKAPKASKASKAPAAAAVAAPTTNGAASGAGADLAAKIEAKGAEIRELKESKPDKATLKPHIDALLALKAEYKEATGSDYAAPNTRAAASAPADGPGAAIAAKITAKGEEIRELKKSKPDKAALQPHIDALLALKAEYKEATGSDYAAPNTRAAAPAKPKGKEPKKKEEKKEPKKKEQKGRAAAPQASSSALPMPKPATGLLVDGKPQLTQLDKHLLDFAYVAGFLPTKADLEMQRALGTSDVAAFPNVLRWLKHIQSFTALLTPLTLCLVLFSYP
ncbi:unnamed protein product [Chrysoparadoxa australica]